MRHFLAAFLLLVSSVIAPAVQMIAADGLTIRPSQAITNELWVVANDVTVGGTVKDDFLAACVGGQTGIGTARLAGTFQNDVWVAGRFIDFTGTAAEHVRFFASKIVMGGKVGMSAVAVGKTVALTSNSVIKGDALLAGKSVVVAGDIRGNLRVFAGTATLQGRVNGNVRIAADDIVIMPGTKIHGDLVYTSSKDIFLDPGKVELDGQLVRKELETIQLEAPPPTIYDIFITQAYFYLCALVVGVPFVAIFPRFTGRAVRWIRQSPWTCTLVGFISFCLIPIASLFVFFTIVGMPLGLLLLLFYLIMIYLSKIIVALGIGGVILRRHGPQPFSRVFTALSLGLITIYVVTSLPMIGAVIAFVVLLTGMGAMTFAIFSSQGVPELPAPPPVSASSPASRDRANQEGPH